MRRHRLVPAFLVGRFADSEGRVMAERRDRNRRLALAAADAGAEVGYYTVRPEEPRAAALDDLLAAVESRAAAVIERLVGGAFPPTAADRRWLSMFVALHLLLGRTHRVGAGLAAALVGELIVPVLEQLEASEDSGDEEQEESPDEAVAAHLVVHDGEPRPASLASLPRLAGFVAARTWQLLCFAAPLILTGDTPVVLWSRPGTAKPYQVGLGSADEVRLPLDPRHALVVARKAPAGEVVRELDERHARALNRTVAEAAREWMYYHPGSDPLERVELAPPAIDE